MKLQEAYDYANLRTAGQSPQLKEKTATAKELSEDLFAEAEDRGDPFIYMTPESWSKKWLPSKKFHLVRLPLNACALPCQPKGQQRVMKKIHAREDTPIVVDYNVNQVGKALHGFTPQVIVIHGKHRFTAATIRGESHINAWVGEAAMEFIPYLNAKKTEVKAGGPGSGRRPAFGGSASKYTGSGRTFYGYPHHTVGEMRPYHILEGSGPNGGEWAAHEAGKGGNKELAIYDSEDEAVDHALHSQD